jgi:alpha-glucoside transport system permease protein
MEQLTSGILAILLGVGGMALYYFGANFILDRVFADQPPSFSVADFLALLSAAVILVAYLWMPWVSETRPVVSNEVTEETVVSYTGSGLLSATFDEGAQNAATVAKTAISLVPLAAVVGIVFAFWGLFEARARGTSAIGTLLAGIIGLVYFLLTFVLGGQNDVDISSAAQIGLWVALISTLSLVLQVVITRPVYMPPASPMAIKVNTETRERVRPWLFVAPALIVLAIYLLYPALDTIRLSFFDRRTVDFVGLDNYAWLFTDDSVLIAFRNNLLWLLVVPFFSVVLGLLVAVLSDRVRWESVAKSLIFMPMAISFVGASVVWRFVYHFAPAGRAQIGLLNAVVTGFGGEPQGWFTLRPINNFFLMVILIWVQVGFAMVLISAALKAVPDETLEAARIDGANEIQLFFRVVLPQILSTVIVVYTTIVIVVLKVFDVVFTMTGGQFDTEVLANQMYIQMFQFGHFGRGSAIAIILMLAVVPVMYMNIRRFRREEAIR